MKYRDYVILLFQSVRDALEFPVKIKTIVTSGNSYTLYVCDIYHAQPNFTVTIDDVIYTITAIDAEESTITVTGSSAITVTTFDLYKPYFFYGTPIQTGMELNKESEVNIQHAPMIYLSIPFDTENENDVSPINIKVTGDVYFLTNGNNLEWLNQQAFDEGVYPMRRLQQHFEKKMREMIGVFDIIPANQSFQIKDFPKFGVYISQKGIPKSMWSDNLSGCYMRINSLGIWDDGKCDKCCI